MKERKTLISYSYDEVAAAAVVSEIAKRNEL
jgi:hypothetical protein